ncbi:hypothetical protein [Rickettsia oklahomensis]|uniref:Uncharacterized protein n=1 Tax=Rickettsia oklahomensis TaxID=3141789 RepID=A0AAU7BZQ1_9RICK
MKNAFEKITAITDKDGKELHNSKHEGALTSLSYNKGSRQETTNLNEK